MGYNDNANQRNAMRTVTALTNNKFLNIKQVVDPENNVNGYQFAERRGVDSIAFVCFDVAGKDGKHWIVNREYTPPTNEFHFRAFGGSLDKDVPKEDIVRAELKEEVGFDEVIKIQLVGRMFVSTQMNQYCYLYVAFVDSSTIGERKPENAIEAMAQPVWMTKEQILAGDDWKSICVVSKFND